MSAMTQPAPYEGTAAPLHDELFDHLDFRIHPIVLCVGKRVFGGGAVPTNLNLLGPRVPRT